MEDFAVVARLSMSAGNETVGEMWDETAIFDGETPLRDVLDWAAMKKISTNKGQDFRGNLVITVGQ